MKTTPPFCLSILLAALGLSAQAASPVFETTREFTASGDFNGDGIADVIIIDKTTGLYRVGTRSAAPTPTFAPSRPTGAATISSAALGKINGTTFDSFAVTGLEQNRVQVLSPTGSGYIEPLSVLNAGVGSETLCALDITTGPSPTAEDDLGLIVANDTSLNYALHEIRSNVGSWSLIDSGDMPDSAPTSQGTPLPPTVGASPFMAFMRNDGAADSFHAIDPTGVGFTEKLNATGLAHGTRYIVAPFQTPNMDLVFYVPGTPTVHVRRITASGPNWVLGADDITTFSASIAQAVPVKDVAGTRMLVRFDNGAVAIYSYTLGAGFGSPTPITPVGAPGVLSGLIPISGNSGFLALYAPGIGQASTTAVSFANSGSGWTQAGITTLPTVSVYSSYANIMLLGNFPFRAENVPLLRSYHAGDWTTGVTVGGGPFSVTAQAANYVSASTGIGASSAQVVGTSPSAVGGTAVNQLHAQFSVMTFDSNLGTTVDDAVISPVAGTYNKSIQITFSGYGGTTTVYYRLGTSGAFTAYNAASPPWVFTDGTVQFYADKTGTGPSPTHSAAYHFSVPPALQDRDGDGVPDFVEVNKGLDPTKGPDSDSDGFTDRDEIAAGTDPKNAANFPGSKASTLSTMIVDASINSRTVASASTGYAPVGTTFTITDLTGNNLGFHIHPVSHVEITGGEIGIGATAFAFGRALALNATGGLGYLVVRSQQNFDVIPAGANEPRGREKIGIVPVPDVDGWSFGATQGTLVTTGTTFNWGGVNFQSGSDNWNGIDDAHGFDNGWSNSQQSLTFAINGASTAANTWATGFGAAANRGAQPYAKITLSPETTMEALIVNLAMSTLYTARGLTPTSPDGVLFDSSTIISPRDLRAPDATHPTAPSVRLYSMINYLHAQLWSGDAGALALRKLALDVYARHEALASDHLGDMTTPLKALSAWVSTGTLPTEYQTGGSMSSTEMTDADNKLNAMISGITARTSAAYTLYVRSTASPVGLTLVQNSGATVTYALFDSDMKAISLPSDITLAAGTPLILTAYNDLPSVSGYTALEVIGLSVSSLPTVIDADSDGDLLADSWEWHHFGTLGNDLYASGDGSAYTLGEEYFRSTDPRNASSSPAGPPTPLKFTSLQLTPDGSGIPWLTTTWPAAYSSFINVNFQASDDLLTWTTPPGFTATDAGGGLFTKALSYDRERRFFRPVASLKR